MVCDAGGGTVDLIAYELQSKKPFSIVPLTYPSSVFAGATEIDRAYFRFLQRVLEPFGTDPDTLGVGGHYSLSAVAENLLRRFTEFKHAFGQEGERTVTIVLPRDCRVQRSEWAQSKVKNGILQIDPEDMEEMFKESVDQILVYIQKQVAQVKVKRRDVTHIFMSGGYSESPYLFRRVRDWARRKAIEVERGYEGWGAVVSGAVLKAAGLGAEAPLSIKLCPRSYGITVSQQYAAHLEQVDGDLFKDKLQGHTMAKNQIVWLARKGDLIPAGEPITASYDLTCNFTSSDVSSGKVTRVSLVASSDDDPPTRLGAVNRGECLLPVPLFRAGPNLYHHQHTANKADAAQDQVIDLDFKYAKIPEGERKSQKRASSKLLTYYSTPVKFELQIDSQVRAKVTCGGEEMVGKNEKL